MAELMRHWTEQSIEDYLYRIASDFTHQIEKLLESNESSQAALAEQLGVSQGRISQVLNNPGNLTLKQVIRYTRALGRKVSIVSYDDNDPDNANGPIHAEIFEACWHMAGRPSDFFSLRGAVERTAANTLTARPQEGGDAHWGKVLIEMDRATSGEDGAPQFAVTSTDNQNYTHGV